MYTISIGSGKIPIDSQVSKQEQKAQNKRRQKVLRGNVVGDNLYSGKWLHTTLLSLCEVYKKHWTPELEDDLCVLWYLSEEKEMVSYLVSHDFLTIAMNMLMIPGHPRLMIPDNPRLTEIILGIIDNLSNNEEIVDKIGCNRELPPMILSYLKSNDSLILIQLLKILQSVVRKIRQDPQSYWVDHLTECYFFEESMISILESSNYDLHVKKAAISLLESMSHCHCTRMRYENSKISLLERFFRTDTLFHALLESFTSFMPYVIRPGKKSHSQLTFVDHWLTMLAAVMGCGSGLKFYYDYENDETFRKLMEIIFTILKLYEDKEDNLYPVQQQSANIICDAVCVLHVFRRDSMNVPVRIDRVVAELIFSLETVSGKRLTEKKKMDPGGLRFKPIRCMFRYWLKIIELFTSEQIVEILSVCECKVREHLLCLSQSEMTPAMIDKVEKVTLIFLKNARLKNLKKDDEPLCNTLKI